MSLAQHLTSQTTLYSTHSVYFLKAFMPRGMTCLTTGPRIRTISVETICSCDLAIVIDEVQQPSIIYMYHTPLNSENNQLHCTQHMTMLLT